jgi:hypothetical protein
MLPRNVDTALQRVIYTLDHLHLSAFQNSVDLIDALDMTKAFRIDVTEYLYRTSMLAITLGKSRLLDSYAVDDIWSKTPMKDCSTADCEFAVNLFNRLQDLTDDERARLEPLLAEVCRAALVGMIRVFQFYEHRRFIIEPILLKKYRHVYLEDSPRSLVEDG